MNLTGFIVLIVLAVMVVLFKGIASNLKHKKHLKDLESLCRNGKIIKAPFLDCEIKTNQHYFDDQFSTLPSQTEMVDAIFRRGNTQDSSSTACYLIYTCRDVDGKDRKFVSSPIFMPIELLRIQLERASHTNIYVDRSDSNRYFFDLRFLKGDTSLSRGNN